MQALTAVNGECKKDMLEKLSALFHVHSVNWLEVDFSRWGEKSRDNQKFEILKSAIIDRRCIKITYAGSYGTITQRVIQPLKLFYKSKDWYVKAYCRLKQDFRLFKLNRILKWELSEEQFVPMSFPDEQYMHQQTYNKIVLSFPNEMAYRVYDEFDLNEISLEKNGDLVVTAYMPEDDWLIGYLLSFGTQVEIIEPVHLKKIVAKKAKKIYKKYKT